MIDIADIGIGDLVIVEVLGRHMRTDSDETIGLTLDTRNIVSKYPPLDIGSKLVKDETLREAWVREFASMFIAKGHQIDVDWIVATVDSLLQELKDTRVTKF